MLIIGFRVPADRSHAGPAEKGYQVSVVDRAGAGGTKTCRDPVELAGFLWFPASRSYGPADRVPRRCCVLCDAVSAAGHIVYANTLYVPPRKFFDAPDWAHITDWAGELAPSIDRRAGVSAFIPLPLYADQRGPVRPRVTIGVGRGKRSTGPGGCLLRPGVAGHVPYFGARPPRRVCSSATAATGSGRAPRTADDELLSWRESRVQGARPHEVYEPLRSIPAGPRPGPAIPAGLSARRICTTAPGPPHRSSSPRTLMAESEAFSAPHAAHRHLTGLWASSDGEHGRLRTAAWRSPRPMAGGSGISRSTGSRGVGRRLPPASRPTWWLLRGDLGGSDLFAYLVNDAPDGARSTRNVRG